MEESSENNSMNSLDILKQGRKIPRKEKFSLGFVNAAGTMLNVVKDIYLFRYYVNIMGLGLEYYILGNFIFLFWNTLNDFFFGMYADRTKHRLGRRIPYIRYGAVFVAITFLFFWFPLPGSAPGDVVAGQEIKFAQFLIALLAYDTVMTIIWVSFGALVLELTESQQERTSLSIYQNIFGAIGGLGIIFVPILFNLGMEVFRIFVIILGIIASMLYFISSYVIKEREELHATVELIPSKILTDLKKIFTNTAFLIAIIFNFSVWFIHGITIQFGTVMGYVIEQDGFELVVNGIFFLVAYPGYVVLHYLAKKIEIDKLIVRISLLCLIIISTLFIIDLIFDVPILYLVIIGVSGTLYSFIIFEFVMFSNAIDFAELNTGERKEAQYTAGKALVTIPLGQLAGIVGASILLAFNYQEGVDSYLGQPDSAIFGIKILIAVIPMVMSLILILTQLVNPLKGNALVEMKKKLLKLHEEKEKQYKLRLNNNNIDNSSLND